MEGGRVHGSNVSVELASGVQHLGHAEDQKLCLTSSTCRNSRKSRIRSDSRVICSKAESHTKRSRTLNGRALLIRPPRPGMGAAVSTGQGWGEGRKGARAGCVMTGVGPQWWRSTAALRTEGWHVAPGCSPDLFPGSAQLQSRHGLPQHASKGSFPAPQPSCLLLLPLSLTRFCFLQ